MVYDDSFYCGKMLSVAGKLRALAQMTVDKELLEEVRKVSSVINWGGHMADNYISSMDFVIEKIESDSMHGESHTGTDVSPKMLIEFLAELLENEAAVIKNPKFHIV